MNQEPSWFTKILAYFSEISKLIFINSLWPLPCGRMSDSLVHCPVVSVRKHTKEHWVSSREKTMLGPKGLERFVWWPLTSLVNFLGIRIRQEVFQEYMDPMSHTSAMVPTKEATLTTGLLFFPTQSTRDGPTGQIPHRLQREACFCQPDQRCEKTQLPEFGSPAPNLGRNRNSKMGTGNKNLCAPSQTIRCSKVICRPRSTKRGCLYSKV